MITTDVIDRMIGSDALDTASDRIGEISQVYLDAESARPTWVSVRLGLLSGAEVLVPLDGAEWDERALHTTVGRDVAREAPRMEQDEPLTEREQERLYTHYGIPTVRHPREDVDLDVAPEDVCYSIRDDDPAAPGMAPVDGPDPELQELSRAS